MVGTSLVVGGDEAPKKLSSFVQHKLQLSSTQLKRCMHKGWILVNDVIPRSTSMLLRPGDVVTTTATSFALAQLRYAMPLLRTVYTSPSLQILWKPGGMPLRGKAAETVEQALPGCMVHSNYQVIDCVNRVAAGPVLVQIGQPQLPLQFSKRYTFQLLLQGRPPSRLDIPGFHSLEILHEMPTTVPGTVLTHVRIVLRHAGDGLRGCLAHLDCPIVGTARTKSAVNGVCYACVKLELEWLEQSAAERAPIVIGMEVPAKFAAAMEREKRFYEEQQERKRLQDEQQATLRSTFLEQCSHKQPQLPTVDWSVVSFCGLPFCVTDSVMAPRTCSEVLVRAARGYLTTTTTNRTVLDLGTGSGCLLIATLAGSNPTITGVGIDISRQALAIAGCNVRAHQLEDRIELREADFANLSGLQASFDVILCNPPYLTEGECKRDNVHGPSVALIAEEKGLSCYRMIAAATSSSLLLRPNGVLVLEIGGKRQEEEICALFHDLEHKTTLLCRQGRKRCIVFRKTK